MEDKAFDNYVKDLKSHKNSKSFDYFILLISNIRTVTNLLKYQLPYKSYIKEISEEAEFKELYFKDYDKDEFLKLISFTEYLLISLIEDLENGFDFELNNTEKIDNKSIKHRLIQLKKVDNYIVRNEINSKKTPNFKIHSQNFTLRVIKQYNSKEITSFQDIHYYQYVALCKEEIFSLVFNRIEKLKSDYREILEFGLNEEINFEKSDNKNEKKSNIRLTTLVIEPKIDELWPVLKSYFPDKEHDSLKQFLITSENESREKFSFQANGNKLSDAFKKLLENNMIVGYNKKELSKIIENNFLFKSGDSLKEFKASTLEKTISGKMTNCKNPIIEIKDGEIVKS